MIFALYGRSFKEEVSEYFRQLISKIESKGGKVWAYKPYYDLFKDKIRPNSDIHCFTSYDEIKNKVDVFLSIGGDGTMLNAITLVRDAGIPVLGINLGKLGFLSSVSKEEIDQSIENVFKGNYTIDQRVLLRLETENKLFGNLNFALNELTIQHKDSASMISIDAWVNDIFLNRYWADGLIISTPTGSTAYSLSCGGPIITPGSNNFIITPIATHNLTVRPIVISDDSVIKLRAKPENEQFLVGLDSRPISIDSSTELIIYKESFKINLLHLPDKDFFSTIRKKLMWGRDIRN